MVRGQKKLLWLGLTLLLGIALWAGWKAWRAPQTDPLPTRAVSRSEARRQADPTASPDAEALLLDLYDDELMGRHQQALTRALQLTNQFPHFQLGQFVYAELLNLSLDQPFAPEALDGLPDKNLQDSKKKSAHERMSQLLLELRQRRNSATPVAVPGWLPRNFLQLAADQPYALAVDVSRSRLYLLAQSKPEQGAGQWTVLSDLYISAGMYGVGKQVEGDGKTPEGVYFVGGKPPNRSLPDLYGSGALTLNYPNALDNLRGKTGSGIWLHGTPSAEYSRPPLDSDGCVVLSNADMLRLQNLAVRGAPIVIADKLEWVDPASLQKEREAFHAVLQRWHQAGQTGQESALKAFYSERFQRNGKGLAQWWPLLLAHAKAQPAPLDAQLKSILRWTDQGDHMIVTLEDANHDRGLWRLYWAKEGADWKIVFEGSVASAPSGPESAPRRARPQALQGLDVKAVQWSGR